MKTKDKPREYLHVQFDYLNRMETRYFTLSEIHLLSALSKHCFQVIIRRKKMAKDEYIKTFKDRK